MSEDSSESPGFIHNAGIIVQGGAAVGTMGTVTDSFGGPSGPGVNTDVIVVGGNGTVPTVNGIPADQVPGGADKIKAAKAFGAATDKMTAQTAPAPHGAGNAPSGNTSPGPDIGDITNMHNGPEAGGLSVSTAGNIGNIGNITNSYNTNPGASGPGGDASPPPQSGPSGGPPKNGPQGPGGAPSAGSPDNKMFASQTGTAPTSGSPKPSNSNPANQMSSGSGGGKSTFDPSAPPPQSVTANNRSAKSQKQQPQRPVTERDIYLKQVGEEETKEAKKTKDFLKNISGKLKDGIKTLYNNVKDMIKGGEEVSRGEQVSPSPTPGKAKGRGESRGI